jgi:hypothetical protein
MLQENIFKDTEKSIEKTANNEFCGTRKKDHEKQV